jgi:4-amino-4-deoxy-L-arabinose transferase-like glycosyltransferase
VHSRAGETAALVVIGVVAAFLRLWRLDSAPGWEWDEPNYANIATNIGRLGDLAIKHDVLSSDSVYLFHPPFYFYLLAGWFKLVGYGITEARVLIALSSLLLLFLCYRLFRIRIGRLALVPVLALACDGWLVFSNRVAWFDHLMLVIGVAGLLVYERARANGALVTYAAAGTLLGAALVFKHLAAYIVLAVLLHWILAGGDRRGHGVLFACVGAVAIVYVASMLVIFGDDYWRASNVQLGRASGTSHSGGGSVSSTADLGTVFDQYRLFYSTIAITIVAFVLLAIRAVQMIRARSRAPVREIGVTFSWLVGGIIFFSVLQIRFPQYFMLVLIPLYGFVGIETMRWLSRRGRTATTVAAVVVTAILAADVVTYVQRIASRDDNALEAVAAYANERIPASDVVMTEQPIGVLIRQPYCETWKAPRCLPRAKWLIYYRTTLFDPEEAYGVRVLDGARRVAVFDGFKETISVYRLG